jgi:ABC-2 type transport system ATP-binding protein
MQHFHLTGNIFMQPVLDICHIRKKYADNCALYDVSLQLAHGRALGLAGLNGAGKTTLIRCILNFAQPDAGSIHLYGLSSHDDMARQQVAYVPERFTGPAYLTGLEYLRFQAQFNVIDCDDNKLERIASELDFDTAALRRLLRTYSKGMTQKLGLISAFASGRNLLILDEPMSGLDPVARAAVRKKLAEHHQAGGSLLMTSHSMSDIETLCDDVAILHRGRLLSLCSRNEIHEQHHQTTEEFFLATIGS